MPRWYKIAAGRDREMFAEFLADRVMAVCFHEFGDRQVHGLSHAEMMQLPEANSPIRTAELFTFVNEVHPGDRVVLYDQQSRCYILGIVISDYEFRSEHPKGYHHFFRVHWCPRVPKG